MSSIIKCHNCGFTRDTKVSFVCPICGQGMSAEAKDNETSEKQRSLLSESAVEIGLSRSDLKPLEIKLNSVLMATNRVNHALRAIVRFILIQLVFSTAALTVYFLNLLTINEEDCSRSGACDPNAFGSFIVFLILVIGIVLSSSIAWKELEHSNVPGVHSGKTLKF